MSVSPRPSLTFADKPTLNGERVTLRPVDVADDPADQSCGFRILLANESFYGRGLGTEATTLILAHAFDTVGVNRIELEVYTFNPRARHVYEKVGFVLEGTKRQALNWHGEWIDADLMAMLASDWRSRAPRAPAETR